jgi:hypothetical protein
VLPELFARCQGAGVSEPLSYRFGTNGFTRSGVTGNLRYFDFTALCSG